MDDLKMTCDACLGEEVVSVPPDKDLEAFDAFAERHRHPEHGAKVRSWSMERPTATGRSLWSRAMLPTGGDR